MNYATIKPWDIANGPGVRVSVFVSGCTHRCKNCFNAEAWDFNYGEPFDGAVMDRIVRLAQPDYIRGVTYLGGEPFDPHNQAGLLELSKKLRAAYPQKSIWSFTGYVYGKNLPQVPGRDRRAAGKPRRAGGWAVYRGTEESASALPRVGESAAH